MAEFQTVCRVAELPEGEGRTVEVNRKLIAVFRDGGQYYAIDDTCPQPGASLGGGYGENGSPALLNSSTACARADKAPQWGRPITRFF